MLADLCAELHNWFEVRDSNGELSGRKIGTFTITNGTLEVEGAKEGQYVRIVGSTYNDGVYQYPLTGLKDETFTGGVWLMAVPEQIVQLSKDIDVWVSKYGDVMSSPYTSESFGGYSYTKSNSGSSDGSGSTWIDSFSDQMKRWRKI